MRIASSTEYAIHGLMYIASVASVQTDGRTVLLRDAASAIAVPESYLRKVFQLLTRRGIVNSQRGARGGYTLARPADDITLRDVVEAVDGPLMGYSCLRQRRHCDGAPSCLVRETFKPAAARMAEVLEGVSIGDIARNTTSQGVRTTWLSTATAHL